MSSEHDIRTVAKTIAAVANSWNGYNKQPADLYVEQATRLYDAGLVQSPETAAELERLRARVAELEAERARWSGVRDLVERALDKGWSHIDTFDLELELGCAGEEADQ